jgi:DNA-binding winged helix-turn-helix (wHTH) protein
MSRTTYRFDEFRITPAARELWCGERLIALPVHVFDCLAYLIEHRDRAVGRDELVAAVWGKAEVSDTLLGQTILRIRRELGDDAREQRMVRTIPRFGYSWAAHVDSDDAARSGEATASASASASNEPIIVEQAPHVEASIVAPARRSRAMLLAASLGIALVLGGLAWWSQRERVAPRRESASASASLNAAVMPSQVSSGAQWSWLRFGVMDVVANRLRSSGVPTVPSESLITLLNTPSSQRPGSLREAAGFRLLVVPNAMPVDEGWRVRLEADDGEGRHWAVESDAREATAAAQLAADKLLVALGRAAPTTPGEAEPYAHALERIDAAILADDPAAARTLIDQAPVAQRQAPEFRLRLAKIDFRGGHFDSARTQLLALLDEAPAETEPVLRAAVLNGLGAAAIRSDHPVDAERYFAESVGLLESRARPAQLGEAYLGRAGAAAEQRHYDAAMADYARARIALTQASDTLALVRVAANEGFLDLERGQPAQALPQLAAAGSGFERWGALNESIFMHIGQIGAHLALLQAGDAMDVADAAAPLAEGIDNRDTIDSLAIARANALAATGRLREARALLGRVRNATPPPDKLTAAVAAIPLARLELDGGNSGAAIALAGSAVDALDPPSFVRQRADAWLIDVRALVRSGDGAIAASAVHGFAEWAAKVDNRHARLSAQLAVADYDRQFGGDWRADFGRARALADEGAIPADSAATAIAYADALLVEGDLEAAAVEVGRLSRWSSQDFGCAVREARLYAALGRDEARQAAVARARALAGERAIPPDALTAALSTREPARR